MVKKKRTREEALFDAQRKKLESQGGTLPPGRTKTVAKYLYQGVFEDEYTIFDAIDSKAGTQLAFLPVAISILASVGGWLLFKGSLQDVRGFWQAAISMYFVTLVAFMVSSYFTVCALMVKTYFNEKDETKHLQIIVNFEKEDEEYYFDVGKEFSSIKAKLQTTNNKKAAWLKNSQIALLVGVISLGIFFIVLSIPHLFPNSISG